MFCQRLGHCAVCREITRVQFNVLQMSGTVTQAPGRRPVRRSAAAFGFSVSVPEMARAVIAEFIVM